MSTASFAPIPGGSFAMGAADRDSYPADGEGPVRSVELGAYRIATTAVTNDEWADFARATGYRSGAEEAGWSFVFAGLLPDDAPPTRGVADAPWWRQVAGATWDRPEGPWSDLSGRGDHPVVHVTWFDAVAYCGWAQVRLPSEAEWERAARGGLHQARYPWGDELTPDGEHRANVWQGTFPDHNRVEDGWYGTCPVDTYAPNGYGLHNAVGNVWEWCADWYDPAIGWWPGAANPTGPATGTNRVIRGGSYLCHHSYCFRYRVAARSGDAPDSCAGNVGFRVAGA